MMKYFIHILLLLCLMNHAEVLSNGESDGDWQEIYVPVTSSLVDLSAPSLDDRGFILLPVTNFDGQIFNPGSVEVTQDRMLIHLKAGDALQLWSVPFPTNDQAVTFTAYSHYTGNIPLQAAIALIDAENPQQFGVMLQNGQDIPLNYQPFSLEFHHQGAQGIVLLQFVGPAQGETLIHLYRMRLAAGIEEIHFALGATQLSETEHFGNGTAASVIHDPPSRGAFEVRSTIEENRLRFPVPQNQSLLMKTSNSDDIIQLGIPLQLKAGIRNRIKKPGTVYGQVYVKKRAGDNGVFSVALFSLKSGSGAIRDYPVKDLPPGVWLKIETSLTLAPESLEQVLLIVQIQSGAAEIILDDISLHSNLSTAHFWKKFPEN
jgi:hypothetical protein